MSSDELWSRDDAPEAGAPGRAEGDALDARVDELFSSAVERQVAEQRNLNRLLSELESSMNGVRGRIDELQSQIARDLAPTGDRVAALDASVRSLRDSSSQQGVALRAELQEVLSAIQEDGQRRARELTEELTEVRAFERDLSERIAEVARSVETALERLDARQEGFASELSRVAARVSEATEAAEEARETLAPVSARLDDAVKTLEHTVARGLDDQAELVRARLDEVLASFDERFAAQLDHLDERVRRQLADAVGTVEDRVTSVTQQLAAQEAQLGEVSGLVTTGVQEGLDQVRRRLAEERDQAREEAREARRQDQEQLAAAHDEVIRLVRERLEAQAQRDAELLDERLGAGLRSLEEGLGRVETKLGERADAQSRQLADALADLETSIRTTVGQVRADIDEQVRVVGAATDEQVAAIAEQVRVVAEQQDATLSGRLDELLAAGATQAQSLREANASRIATLREAVREELGRLRETTEAHRSATDAQLGELLASQTSSAEALRETTQEQLSGLRAEVDRLREELAGETRGSLDTLGTELRERVTEQAAQLAAGLDAMQAELRSHAAAVTARAEATEDELAAQRSAFRGDVGEMRESIERHQSVQSDRIDAALEGLVATLGDRIGSLQEQVEERMSQQAAAAVELRGAMADLLRSELALAREELGGQRADIQTQLDAQDERLGVRTDEVAAAVARVLETLDQRAEDLRSLVAEQERALDTRIGELQDGAASLVGRVEERLDTGHAELLQLQLDHRTATGAQLDAQEERLRSQLAEHREGVAGQLSGHEELLAQATDRIRGMAAAVAEELAQLETLGAQLTQARSLDEEARAQLRTDLSGTLEARIEEGVARLRDRLEDGLAGLRSRFDEQLTTVTGELEVALGPRLDLVTGAIDDLREKLTDAERDLATQARAVGTLGDGFADIEDRLAVLIDEARSAVAADQRRSRERAAELEEQLSATVARLGEETRREAAQATGDLREASLRLTGMFEHLENLESSLVAYLDSRDQRLERERVALVRDLVEQLADNLSKRERRRLASRLEVPDAPRLAPAAGSESPWARTPSTDAAPRRIVREPDDAGPSFGRAAPDATTAAPTGTTEPVAQADDETSPVSAPAADEAPSLREVLAEVRGIGPAKQSLLIDTFGDLASLRAARREDLTALRGITDELADAVLEHVRTR